MKSAKPSKKLYKIIGMCRHCKQRFVVDMTTRYASRNYCSTCSSKYKQGGK